jgi:hypothetical protein
MREGWLEGVKGEGNPGRKVWAMQPGMGQIGVFLSFLLPQGQEADDTCNRRSLLFVIPCLLFSRF